MKRNSQFWHLRKHDEIPKGTRFVLVSRFVGGDRVLMKR